ncbi:SpoIID/LytB domain-containing protein [Candidatus Aerophobetes bacterium]|nr:SpoIID/LytB domain-containing protein [Candidatus Aerophobetes bacterium]
MLVFAQLNPWGENKLYPEACFAYLPTPHISVRIARGEDFSISATSSYLIRNNERSSILSQPTHIKPSPEGISINGKIWGENIWIEPTSGSLCKLNERRYRGAFIITQRDKSILEVINRVSLEEYLYGLIKMEISPGWPLATLLAQAIAARTYALRKLWEEDLVMSDSIQHQVYGGVEAEDPRGTIAVDLTRGEILTYEGKPINALYHASSGGYLTSSKEVWGEDFPYLQAKKDPFSIISPYQDWTLKLSGSDLEKMLQVAGFSIKKIKALTIIEKDASRRVKLLLISSEGKTSYISGRKLREIIGFNLLRSTFFEVENKKDEFIFRGHGWGHGVGMSQWGAATMGKMGYSVEEILQFYYPGCDIYRAY